jgi:KUP system potassium uptake protein
MTDSTAAPEQPADRPAGHDARHAGIVKLAVGAVGIVFGDIGTSPIYAFRETFAGHHPLAPDPFHIVGVLSLIFWSMMIVVSLKYVTVIMRADNKGEGGSLALLALINRKSESGRRKWTGGIVLLGVFATALFYGDSMITPAISVLSAVEGITTVEPALGGYVLPVAVGILVALFAIQARGTAKVGAMFGPVMLVYFFTISVLGISHIIDAPGIIVETLNPLNAIRFFYIDGISAFLALGSVVLAVTGAEALYADMGHFGRKPIGISWLWFVMPALMLNYMGQGAMIVSLSAADAAEVVKNPFFFLAPEALRLPLVILATMATVIASQAVISGAFSVTQQAIQLGFIPRLRITHTSATAAGPDLHPGGQLDADGDRHPAGAHLPRLEQPRSRLRHRRHRRDADRFLPAYRALLSCGKWKLWQALPLLALFFIVDIAYFAANLTKVPDGGWFPLLVGLVGFTLLTTWARGRKLMLDRMREASMPVEIFVKSAANSATRVSARRCS